MEKLLIVDDEIWIVEGLKAQFDWKKLGITLTTPAYNGLDALQIIEKEQPSIILTDIKMPKMDGLALAQYIFEHHIECELIIISGFADFEYAKRAISYHVSDYLTKPLDAEEFLETIEKVKRTLLTKRQQRKERFSVIAEQRNHELSSKYLSVTPSIANEKSFGYFTTVLQILSIFDKENPHNTDLVEFQNQMNSVPSDIFHNIIFKNQSSTNQYILISDFDRKSDISLINKKLVDYLNGLLIHLEKRFELIVTIAISNPYYNTNQSFQAYLETKFIVENLNNKNTNIMTASEFQENYEQVSIDEIAINEIITLLESGTLDSIHPILHKFIYSKTQNDKSLFTTRMNIQAFLLALSSLLQKHNSNLYLINHKYIDFFKRIWEIDTFESLENQCTNLIDEIYAFIHDEENEDNVILQIKKYIDSHYSENLTLQAIAQDYYLNPSYLSRAFKKELNINFNDYIKQKRMEQATYLLLNTDMKIYEIAEKVGYDNENYFMKKFRDMYGLTPKQYKDTQS